MDALIDRMQTLVAGWMPFLSSHLRRFPQDLDGQETLVYGTGYSSWGVWTVINPAIVLAGSLDWAPEIFSDAPSGFRTRQERLDKCLGLLRYVLGYHATGDFDGAGGDRWSGEPKGPGEVQGYANWHSPLWVCLLADAMLMVWDEVPEAMRKRFLQAVRNDAEIQASLDIENFRGEAADSRQPAGISTGGSHPEGNSWRASLLTLARSLMPDDPQAKAWEERENILWASSFARPGDDSSDELVGGHKLSDLVIGSNLCPSFVAIHHRFLHPCYTTFPLFSRVEARTYCARSGLPYPASAERFEGEVLARLLQFMVGERLVHPAGNDWPEWAYHQFVLMAVLAYHHACGAADLSAHIDALLSNVERDAQASAGGALLSGRFATLLQRSGHIGHRYESDAPACLVYAERFLSSASPAEPVNIADLEPRFCEDLARTVYERRPSGAYGFSSRAGLGPVQMTLVPAQRPHLAVWSANGSCSISSLHLPHATVTNDLTESSQALLAGGGFAARAVLSQQGPYLPCLSETEIRCGLAPEQDLLMVHQKVVTRAFGWFEKVLLHRWRIGIGVHSGRSHDIAHATGVLSISEDVELERTIEGDWVCIDGCLSLILVRPPDSGGHGRWRVRVAADQRDDERGTRWFEIACVFDLDPAENVAPDAVIAEAGLIARADLAPDEVGEWAATCSLEITSEGPRFATADGQWTLSAEPDIRC